MERIKLTEGQEQIISYPVIQGMMTGTKFIKLSKDNIITIIYEDDTTEKAKCTNDEWDNFKNIFSIVNFVQSKR
jgi:hypothetical protein